MSKIFENAWVWNQPQLLSLCLTVMIVLVISIIVYIKVSKVKENEAPKGVAQIAEAYVGMIDKSFDELTGKTQIQKARLYIFSLGTFIFIGNLVTIFGFEPIVTSYSIPLTLALMTWLGIFITGAIWQKWHYLKSFKNPLDWFGKISPLISLSFRIYGNVIGGAIIILLVYLLGGYVWSQISGVQITNFDQSTKEPLYIVSLVISPALHFYFDLFGSTLQAYIFTLLTGVYWVVESTGEGENDLASETTKEKKYHLFKRKKLNLETSIY
ncbi:F0F1 ATP synthase subunit A [Mycoplasma nasistruthionis]|uniref:F0F1 ATP synthase subunit A n=1 Tax=Mycoplasma nasistruthionis TaxID=353852 RepID=A0A4Y6I6U1_9MOLU|nr:F0F1 ATP synthase subunit A [Mycoplasma nasistruthionis]QCZ36673.1 F0F1 ATP synthase subunit A [Mycoplasma nasistruthionis]QDF64967.1 F0F1 ATP synthase subunit A [Mycoplasma nasistruthionis]